MDCYNVRVIFFFFFLFLKLSGACIGNYGCRLWNNINVANVRMTWREIHVICPPCAQRHFDCDLFKKDCIRTGLGKVTGREVEVNTKTGHMEADVMWMFLKTTLLYGSQDKKKTSVWKQLESSVFRNYKGGPTQLCTLCFWNHLSPRFSHHTGYSVLCSVLPLLMHIGKSMPLWLFFSRDQLAFLLHDI